MNKTEDEKKTEAVLQEARAIVKRMNALTLEELLQSAVDGEAGLKVGLMLLVDEAIPAGDGK